MFRYTDNIALVLRDRWELLLVDNNCSEHGRKIPARINGRTDEVEEILDNITCRDSPTHLSLYIS